MRRAPTEVRYARGNAGGDYGFMRWFGGQYYDQRQGSQYYDQRQVSQYYNQRQSSQNSNQRRQGWFW